MSNILPPAGAESVHFSPPVVDNESSEPHRDREALASVLKEGWIAGFGDAPLPDEELRPGMSQDEALKQLDPVVAEQLDETRLPDEVAFDKARASSSC